jgi:hypothetical protein
MPIVMKWLGGLSASENEDMEDALVKVFEALKYLESSLCIPCFRRLANDCADCAVDEIRCAIAYVKQVRYRD